MLAPTVTARLVHIRPALKSALKEKFGLFVDFEFLTEMGS